MSYLAFQGYKSWPLDQLLEEQRRARDSFNQHPMSNYYTNKLMALSEAIEKAKDRTQFS